MLPLPPITDFRWVLLPLAAGAVALYFLLPRPQGRQVFYGAVLGILALALGGIIIVNVGGVSVETVLFYTFAGLALIGGTLLVTHANPARAALAFVVVILSVCGLFLLLAAPFLMAATIIVYAGAIVVTFLFVLMLAQQTGPSDADMRSREPLLTSLTGFVLLGALLYVLQLGFLPQKQPVDPRPLDVFLRQIREAEKLENAADIEKALNADADKFSELIGAIEQMRAQRDRDRTEEQNRNEKVNLEKDLIDNGVLFRLKKALEMAGRKDLADLTENYRPARHYAWPPPDDPEAKNADALKAVLRNYEALLLAARTDVGLAAPDWTRAPAQSDLSGPPSARSGQLRRDAEGRPFAPAENSAYLGKSLFSDYLLSVELGGFLLLVAVVGAIAIAHRHQTTGRPS